MAKPQITDQIQTSAEAHEATAIPCARVVHTGKNPPKTAELEPLPEGMSADDIKTKSPAQWAYERLILYIRNFESQLDSKHEVAMGFTGGDAGIMRIEGMGFFDPDIVFFYGTDDTEKRTQLIQHVSQLNVMLRAMPKATEEAEPRRIGFHLAADLKRN